MEEVEIRARQHLHELIKTVISDTFQLCNYTDWNKEWKTVPASRNSILQFMFGLKSEDEIQHFRENYQHVVSDYLNEIENDELALKRYFRFYLSLPVFEYEIKMP